MATLESAKKKWEEKTANAGVRWKKGVEGKQSAYAEGVAHFLGVSPADIGKDDDWANGVARVSASDFQNAIAGKGDKWARKLKEAMLTE